MADYCCEVNAYVKKVATADLDTWNTVIARVTRWLGWGYQDLPKHTVLFISGIRALCSYPSPDAVPETQSIHPMMNAMKGVTPPAPVTPATSRRKCGMPQTAENHRWGCESNRADKHRPGGQRWRDMDSSNFRLGSWNAGSSIAAIRGKGR